LSSAKQSRRISLIKWVGTLLSAILLIILLSQQNWQSVGQALSQIPFWRFAVAFLLMVISRFAVASRWYVLLHATCTEVSWGQSVKYTFAGLFATNFLPSTIGGDIVRLAGAVRSGVDAAMATASLVMDRLVGMFGMVLMLPFGILPLYNWFSSNPAIVGFPSNGDTLMLSFPFFKKIWTKVLSFT